MKSCLFVLCILIGGSLASHSSSGKSSKTASHKTHTREGLEELLDLFSYLNETTLALADFLEFHNKVVFRKIGSIGNVIKTLDFLSNAALNCCRRRGPQSNRRNDTISGNFSISAEPLPKDCRAAYDSESVAMGQYRISPDGSSSMNVWCESGATVIQRRSVGNVNFNRSWDEYVNGFGDVSGDVWLGLDNLRMLVEQQNYTLRIELLLDDEFNREADYYTAYPEDGNGQMKWIEAAQFSVGAGSDYKLTFRDITTNIKRANRDVVWQAYMDGMKFSTYDRDQDRGVSKNCAAAQGGGFWHYSCSPVNPNVMRGSFCSGNHPVCGFVWPLRLRSVTMKLIR